MILLINLNELKESIINSYEQYLKKILERPIFDILSNEILVHH